MIVAAIAAVFTIGYVANMLGEDEDWLHDLSVDMFPEDGCLRVYGVGEDGVTAFTEYGIECLRQIIADERAAGDARPRRSNQRNSLPMRCSPHAYGSRTQHPWAGASRRHRSDPAWMAVMIGFPISPGIGQRSGEP